MCYHILHIIHNDFSCLELKGNSEREKSSNLKRIFEIIRHPCISIVVLFLLSYNSTSFFFNGCLLEQYGTFRAIMGNLIFFLQFSCRNMQVIDFLFI